ncbi:FAD-dependent oxidoreductase [Candidatus Omnitrophota bacterium]
MKPLSKLFEPGMIGKMEVKNRIVMSPMGHGTGSKEGGYMTDRTIAYYGERAKGGVGLVAIGANYVSRLPHRRGVTGVYDDSQIPGLQKMAHAIKSYGAMVSLQLLHPGPRLPEYVPGGDGVGPSARTDPRTGITIRALSKEEIAKLVEDYAVASARIKRAGYDAVDIHGAHGYLINNFMSPWTNKRTDEYGGSIENRARFSCEIVRAVREEVGPDFPIIFRMMGDDGIDAGIKIDEAKQQAILLVEAGADALHISSGIREALHKQFPTIVQESGCLVELAAAIKKVVKVPIITVGKLNPVLGERVLEEGKADFIAMGRALIADPELANKAREGRFEDIRPCIYCNLGCRDTRWQNPDLTVTCSVSPQCGHELDYELEPTPAAFPKRVVVVGGGLAGMEAARNLSLRGHEVSLYEKEDRLGGQWNIVAAYRPDVAALTAYLSRGLEKGGVKVFLNQAVDTRLIQEVNPDAVVIAAGATQVIPDIPDVEGENVVLASDVLRGRVEVGQNVVIIGGRLVGLETALFLAERGKRVSVVDIVKIAQNVGLTMKLSLREKLINSGVYLYPYTTTCFITKEGVHAINDVEWMFLQADTVVLAVGSKSENRLAEEIKGLVPEIYTIGDCVEPRNSQAAIHEGAKIGREI